MRGKKTGGRQKGTPNKLTQSAREAFQLAFDRCGGAQGLTTWARKNPTEFYKIYGRLIPMEVVGEGGSGPVQTVVTHVYEQVAKAGNK